LLDVKHPEEGRDVVTVVFEKVIRDHSVIYKTWIVNENGIKLLPLDYKFENNFFHVLNQYK